MAVVSRSFTGERPGWGEGFGYDESRHLAAYRFARTLAPGKKILDAGCGEGFGTQLLADVAAEVVGMDCSEDAIGFCRRRWRKPNLEFVCCDLTEPGVFQETFDLVVNFQVIEHIPQDLSFLQRLKTYISPSGTLLLTTPNRLKSFSENPYHVREYTPPEFEAVVRQVFPHVTILGIQGNAKVVAFDRAREQSVKRVLRLDPLGLRYHLPTWLVHRAFARLAILVRRRANSAAGADRIKPEDFSVGAGGLDDALDLVALCCP